jgi:hypothetical protein
VWNVEAEKRLHLDEAWIPNFRVRLWVKLIDAHESGAAEGDEARIDARPALAAVPMPGLELASEFADHLTLSIRNQSTVNHAVAAVFQRSEV